MHTRYQDELARQYAAGVRDGMVEFIARLRGERGRGLEDVGVVYDGPLPPALSAFLQRVERAISETDINQIADDVMAHD